MSEVITLTENDFSLMNEALDSLTKSGRHPVQEILFEVMSEKMLGNDRGAIENFKRMKIVHDKEEKKKQEGVVEEVRLLQAKLIHLKRELINKANLKETDSIINFVK